MIEELKKMCEELKDEIYWLRKELNDADRVISSLEDEVYK